MNHTITAQLCNFKSILMHLVLIACTTMQGEISIFKPLTSAAVYYLNLSTAHIAVDIEIAGRAALKRQKHEN